MDVKNLLLTQLGATDVMMAGKVAVVAGYGDVGKERHRYVVRVPGYRDRD